MSNEYLAHYGVKGMKWGVRKDRRSGSARGVGALRKKWDSLPPEKQQRYKKLMIQAGIAAVTAGLSAGAVTGAMMIGATSPVVQSAAKNAVEMACELIGDEVLATQAIKKTAGVVQSTVTANVSRKAGKAAANVLTKRKG